MTTLEALALIEYLNRCGLLSIPTDKHDYEKTIRDFQKSQLSYDWKEKFFNQNPKQ